MNWTEKTWIVATCGRGCADVLKAELNWVFLFAYFLDCLCVFVDF